MGQWKPWMSFLVVGVFLPGGRMARLHRQSRGTGPPGEVGAGGSSLWAPLRDGLESFSCC